MRSGYPQVGAAPDEREKFCCFIFGQPASMQAAADLPDSDAARQAANFKFEIL
jgi:hypothetical protein